MFDYTSAELTVLPIALGIVIVVALLVGYLLRNKTDKQKNIALMVVAGIMLIMEVIKQWRAIDSGSYSLWNIPLHYCSMFMVWYSLAAFGRGRVQQAGRAIAMASSMLFFVTFYFAPKTVIGSSSADVFGSFGNFHTFFYHHFIMLFLALLLTLKLYKPQWKDLKWVFLAYVIYPTIAVIMANVLQTNYASLLTNVLTWLDVVRINFGYDWYVAMMMAIGIGGTSGFHILFTWIYNKTHKQKMIN